MWLNKRHWPWQRFGVLIAALLAVFVSASFASTATAQSQDKIPNRWAILGDSYLSGQGFTPPAIDAFGQLVLGYEPDTNSANNSCFRVSTSWGLTLAQHFQAQSKDVLFVACSGATTAHVTTNPQFPTSPPNVPGGLPQIEELIRFNELKPVDVVLLTVGGNDAGFVNQITSCLMQTTCSPADHPVLSQDVDSGRTVLEERLVEVVRQIRDVAPQATILVAGYPSILPLSGVSCDDVGNMSVDNIAALQQYLRAINQSVRAGAISGGAHYLDVSKALKGIHLCSPTSAGVNPIGVRVFSAMHPTVMGHNAIARYITPAVEGVLQGAR